MLNSKNLPFTLDIVFNSSDLINKQSLFRFIEYLMYLICNMDQL